MRRTVIRKNGREKTDLYTKVMDVKEIQKIGSLSEDWKVYGVRSNCNYIILEQRRASGKPTKYYKIIKKSKAEVRGLFYVSINAEKKDWTYYKKRRPTDEV